MIYMESVVRNLLLEWFRSDNYIRYITLGIVPEFNPPDEYKKKGYLGYIGYIYNDEENGVYIYDGVNYINTDYLLYFNSNVLPRLNYNLIEMGTRGEIFCFINSLNHIKIDSVINNLNINLFGELSNTTYNRILLFENNIKNNNIFINNLILDKPKLMSDTIIGNRSYLDYSLLVFNNVHVKNLVFTGIENELTFNYILSFIDLITLKYDFCVIKYQWSSLVDYIEHIKLLKLMGNRLLKYENIKIEINGYLGDECGLKSSLNLNNIILGKTSENNPY